MVRRVLKDNKVPGTSSRTRVAEAPGPRAGSTTGFLGESQAGLCERPGACLDQGCLNRKNFSKRKRENRGTQQLVRELSQQPPLAPLPPQPLDCERGISSPSAHLKPSWRALRLADWGPTTETLAGSPHLKPWLGAHTCNLGWVCTGNTG